MGGVDLRNASTVMRMQVISTGRRLATYDALAQEAFEDHTYSAYARLNERCVARVREEYGDDARNLTENITR